MAGATFGVGITLVVILFLAAPIEAQTAAGSKNTVSQALLAEALANKNKQLSQKVIGDITARLNGNETQQETDSLTQEVELRSADGLVSLHGTILDFDDALITIEESFGVVSVERDGLECLGAACPPELLAASEAAPQDTNLNLTSD